MNTCIFILLCVCTFLWIRDIVFGIVTRLRAGRSGPKSRQVNGLLSSKMFRVALGPKQLPSHWMLGTVSPLRTGRSVRPTTNLSEVSRLSISGAILPLSVYVFMLFTEAASLDFHLTFLYVFLIHSYSILASLCRQFTIFPIFYKAA